MNFIVWVKYFNKYKFYMVSPLANKHALGGMLTNFLLLLGLGNYLASKYLFVLVIKVVILITSSD